MTRKTLIVSLNLFLVMSIFSTSDVSFAVQYKEYTGQILQNDGKSFVGGNVSCGSSSEAIDSIGKFKIICDVSERNINAKIYNFTSSDKCNTPIIGSNFSGSFSITSVLANFPDGKIFLTLPPPVQIKIGLYDASGQPISIDRVGISNGDRSYPNGSLNFRYLPGDGKIWEGIQNPFRCESGYVNGSNIATMNVFPVNSLYEQKFAAGGYLFFYPIGFLGSIKFYTFLEKPTEVALDYLVANNSQIIKACAPINFNATLTLPADCYDGLATKKSEIEKATKAAAEAVNDAKAKQRALQDAADTARNLIYEAERKRRVLQDAADAESATKAAAAKIKKVKITITCTRGKIVRKVTAVKPKCPAGYKIK